MKRMLCSGSLLLGEFAAQGGALRASPKSLVDASLAAVCGLVWLLSAYYFARSICGGMTEQDVAFSDLLMKGERK